MTADARWPCLAPRAGGCTLEVAVSPNARRTAADGLRDGALRVRLAAPPVDGKANQRLCEWLADELGCARRGVTLLRGATARRKQVAIELPPGEVASWLDRQFAAAAG